ncbi:sensor histidine kinase [Paenibacillus spongiae]|uniref:histidine kinase n=1 Tax=Paenibacillus spongiae TaxID=2909671 RepID=A0ABY5SB15_9BACL|nr:HAMP domain-containing sensor histidine kinase [Paenibacillus spongiae]UVI31121.1 HAMP domain-containing histidine kinase [Paenibacillus spongiae]
MNAVRIRWWVSAAVTILFFILLPSYSFAEPQPAAEPIAEWEIQWTNDPDSSQMPRESANWVTVDSGEGIPDRPSNFTSMWIKFELPQIDAESGMLIEKMYGQSFEIFVDGASIHSYNRSNLHENNRFLLPLSAEDSGKTVMIFGKTHTASLGLYQQILVGDYQQMLTRYSKADLLDIVLGFAFLFMSAVMLICSVFLSKEQRKSWISLSLVILAIGVLIITYAPFLYIHYGEYGTLFLDLFDIALYLFIPSLTYFFESIFGAGPKGIVRKFRKFQIYYSCLCLAATIINDFTTYTYFGLYDLVTVTLVGLIALVQIILIISMSITYAVKGNKEAIIVSSGFGIFAAAAVGELFWYYMNDGHYKLYMWKWGMVGFILALLVLLGRRLAYNHRQVVKYSQELEVYNHQLQRSEKMEIISQLAASVAHEVRNPMQVTRGFLQLLGENAQLDRERNYLKLAIDELDRAASIITNYLTFAKPQLEEMTILNLHDELRQVEGIIVPLANLQGGKIQLSVPKHLFVEGNSSKFKQALINIIKNSIESLKGNGLIQLSAFEEGGEVILQIRDNGEGMDKEVLAKLGEPYFSNKTKGTGLGLMVTFRIIELMHGKLQFQSEKGVGTVAMLRFPSVSHETKNGVAFQ